MSKPYNLNFESKKISVFRNRSEHVKSLSVLKYAKFENLIQYSHKSMKKTNNKSYITKLKFQRFVHPSGRLLQDCWTSPVTQRLNDKRGENQTQEERKNVARQTILSEDMNIFD